MKNHPDDWLVLGGDLGETIDHLDAVLDAVLPRFGRVIWVPGNHELWTISSGPSALRGRYKYEALVSLCRARGVLTPEDPYLEWPGPGPKTTIVPMFLLYDYSFRPDNVSREEALAWAADSGVVVCTDEAVLHPDPYATREAWCKVRCDETEQRLRAIPEDQSTVLINHFPLRRDLA